MGRLTDALRTNSTYRRAAVDHDDVWRSNGRERGRAMEWKTSENYRLNLSRHNSSMTTPSGRREEKQLLYNNIFYFVRFLIFLGLKLSTYALEIYKTALYRESGAKIAVNLITATVCCA